MYARSITPVANKTKASILYQCLDCEEIFHALEKAQACPACQSKSRSNLVIIHMEDDAERSEWLSLIEFSAGD